MQEYQEDQFVEKSPEINKTYALVLIGHRIIILYYLNYISIFFHSRLLSWTKTTKIVDVVYVNNVMFATTPEGP